MLLYCLPATLVFSTIVLSLLNDESTPNTDVGAWLFLTLATLLWPIVLPSILRQKARKVVADFNRFPSVLALAPLEQDNSQ